MKRQVSILELIAFFLGLRGATFATFAVETDARAKKRGNPYGAIRKRSVVNGQLNFHYDKAVIRRLEKEGKAGEFEAGSSWHTPVIREDGTLTPLAAKKGESEAKYVRFRLLAQVAGPEYFDLEGHRLEKEQVEEFLPPRTTYANQGTEEPVVFLTYGLDSILEVTAEGETLVVNHEGGKA